MSELWEHARPSFEKGRKGKLRYFESPEELWDAAVHYFEWCKKNAIVETKAFSSQGFPVYAEILHERPFTIGGLYTHMGISQQTWYDYKERDEFKDIIKIICDIIIEQKFSGAAVGQFNPVIIARDLGLVDKTEQSITLTDDFDSLMKESLDEQTE